MLVDTDEVNGVQKSGYISTTGEYVGYDPRLAFMHELIHAITGLTDNEGSRAFTSSADSLGPAQVISNKIHSELNPPSPLRASYDGAAFLHERGGVVITENGFPKSIERGTQFTKGKIVDAANNNINIGTFVSTRTFNNNLDGRLTNGEIDTSDNSPATNDLFIYRQAPEDTFATSIIIETGAGNDYLYGSDGNDQLIAGGDNDYLNGGGGNDDLRGDDSVGGTGTDRAEFTDDFANYDPSVDGKTITFAHNRGTQTDGTDTLQNIEFAQFANREVDLRQQLDLAFVVDTTGSMVGSIDAVKASASNILDAVFENALNSRIAVVGYNDPDTNTFLSFTEQPNISDRKDAAIIAINSLYASGGDDYPEAVNAGLIRALSGGAGQWRSEASARRIILFGDAPPKDTALRSQVLSLAANVGGSVSSNRTSPVSSSTSNLAPLSIVGKIETSQVNEGLAKTTFDIQTLDANGSTTTAPVEIFTVLIGNDPTTYNDFNSLATATGGRSFTTSSTSELVNSLIQAIEVPAINTPPIAVDDKLTIDEDVSTTVLATDLLSNDSDINSVDTLRIIGVDNVINGTASINSGGNINFTPTAEFSGKASFDYIVTDGRDSDTASVEVTVNSVQDAPIANRDNVSTNEDTPLTILTTELLSNDINVETGNSLSLSGINNVVNGTAFINVQGNISFTPATNFFGKASFDYIVTDGTKNSTASVEVMVNPVNDPPSLTKPIPDIKVTQNAPNSIIKLADYFEDVENGDNLSYMVNASTSFQGSATGKFYDLFSIDSAKTLTLDYENNVLGTSTIAAKVTDSNNESVEDTFSNFVINSTINGDSLLGGDGNDYLDGKDGNDTLIGVNGNDTLVGSEGNDTLKGGDGDDSLFGGIGDDTLTGDTGNDTYVIDTTTDILIENANEGTDTVAASVTYSLGATSNLENLTLTGTSAINAAGNNLNNSITGNAANNTLSGGAGNDSLSGDAGIDTLIGGVGNDTYVVDTTTDILIENANEGTDTVAASVTYSLGANSNLENITLTGSSVINATGNAVNNALEGNSADNSLSGDGGNDTLAGGAGIDTLIGGAGNDLYTVDTATDTITENANEGTDTVAASVNHTLGINLENLTLTGTSAIDGTGNILNNSITGNTGDNTLSGGVGSDTMTGGTGNDVYIIDAQDDIVIETSTIVTEIDSVQSSLSYTLGSNLENLILTGISGINGTGNNLNNRVTGNAANNILSGGAGSDTMAGGTGNDIYIIDNASDAISETSTSTIEIDNVESNVTYTLSNNLENLVLTGAELINGTGNNLSNTINGNSASNTLKLTVRSFSGWVIRLWPKASINLDWEVH
jgi:Ca2+-binding RTX toxin-like protein